MSSNLHIQPVESTLSSPSTPLAVLPPGAATALRSFSESHSMEEIRALGREHKALAALKVNVQCSPVALPWSSPPSTSAASAAASALLSNTSQSSTSSAPSSTICSARGVSSSGILPAFSSVNSLAVSLCGFTEPPCDGSTSEQSTLNSSHGTPRVPSADFTVAACSAGSNSNTGIRRRGTSTAKAITVVSVSSLQDMRKCIYEFLENATQQGVLKAEEMAALGGQMNGEQVREEEWKAVWDSIRAMQLHPNADPIHGSVELPLHFPPSSFSPSSRLQTPSSLVLLADAKSSKAPLQLFHPLLSRRKNSLAQLSEESTAEPQTAPCTEDEEKTEQSPQAGDDELRARANPQELYQKSIHALPTSSSFTKAFPGNLLVPSPKMAGPLSPLPLSSSPSSPAASRVHRGDLQLSSMDVAVSPLLLRRRCSPNNLQRTKSNDTMSPTGAKSLQSSDCWKKLPGSVAQLQSPQTRRSYGIPIGEEPRAAAFRCSSGSTPSN